MTRRRGSLWRSVYHRNVWREGALTRWVIKQSRATGHYHLFTWETSGSGRPVCRAWTVVETAAEWRAIVG